VRFSSLSGKIKKTRVIAIERYRTVAAESILDFIEEERYLTFALARMDVRRNKIYAGQRSFIIRKRSAY